MRYALYFSPAENHPLTKAAALWLGRNAFNAETFPVPDVEGLEAEDVRALTADPCRYGFHATIKAPFELAEGRSEEELVSAVESFAVRTPAFDIPNVIVAQPERFFAIIPDQVYPELQEFAASIVRDFEPFRAPLSDADIARRKPERLSPSKRANLERWGYPYVMDDFGFHMTLTTQVPDEKSPAMRAELDRRFAAFSNVPLTIDALALFIEPERGAPFTVHSRVALAPAADRRKTAS